MQVKELHIRSVVLWSTLLSIMLITFGEMLTSFKSNQFQQPIHADFIHLDERKFTPNEMVLEEVSEETDESDEEVDEEVKEEVVIDDEFTFFIVFKLKNKLSTYFTSMNSSVEFVNRIEFPPEISL
jgi:hypothetical protein